VKSFALRGGVDQITPKALVPPGKLQDCYNYEVGRDYGYASIEGFEAFDGRMSPSSRDIWDLTVPHQAINPIYSDNQFDVSAQTANMDSVAFKTDGTRMFVLDGGAGMIYQYGLSVAWDVSTAGYTIDNDAAVAEDADYRSIRFSADGLKMYLLGKTNKTIYEYDLQDPWDIEVVTYSTNSLLISGGQMLGIEFKPDGTEVYILDFAIADRRTQYTLSTAWDISTGTLTTQQEITAAGADTPAGIGIPSHGYLLYTVNTTNTVVVHSMSTAWDVSTVALVDTFAVNESAGTDPVEMFISPNGAYLYYVGDDDIIYQYNVLPRVNENITMSRGLEAQALGTVVSVTAGATTTAFRMAFWDQTKRYLAGAVLTGDVSGVAVTDGIDAVPLNEGNDDISPELGGGATIRGLVFRPNGLQMYVGDGANPDVYEYELSTAWDITTSTYKQASTNIDATSVGWDIAWSSDGFTFYQLQSGVGGSSGFHVSSYLQTTSRWNITKAALAGRSGMIRVKGGTRMTFNAAGTKFYILGAQVLYEYTMSTAWDVDTALLTYTFSFNIADAGMGGVTFSGDGLTFYVVGFDVQAIYQFSCSTAWDLSSASYDLVVGDISSYCPEPKGVYARPDGPDIYVVDATNVAVYGFINNNRNTIATLVSSMSDTTSYFDALYNVSTVLRSAIEPVPGTGIVSGVKWYKNNLYAIRDYYHYHFANANASEAPPQVGQRVVMYQLEGVSAKVYGDEGIVRRVETNAGNWADATSSAHGTIVIEPADNRFDWHQRLGGQEIPNLIYALLEIHFSSGSIEPVRGDTLSGQTSGETVVVYRVELTSGAWADGDAAGVIYADEHAGQMTATELIDNDTTVDLNVLTLDYEMFGADDLLLWFAGTVSDGHAMAGLYQSSIAGWQKIDLGLALRFNTGTTEPTTVAHGADTSTQTVAVSSWNVATTQRDLGGWDPSAGSEIDAVGASGGANVVVGTTVSLNPLNFSEKYFAVHGFGFSLAEGSRVVGIEIEITAKSTAGTDGAIIALQPFLNDSDAFDGGDFDGIVPKRQANGDLTNAFVAYTFGGENDLWGADITKDVVEDTNFGVKLNIEGYATSNVQIDFIRMRVHYVEQGSLIYFYDTVLTADFATAQLVHLIEDSGTWAGADVVGTMYLYDLSRAQIPTKNIQIRDAAAGAGNLIGNMVGGEIRNSLPGSSLLKAADSKYQMIAENMYARDDLEAIYAASGAGRAFSYDGEYVRFIGSGITESLDKPRHIELFQFRLWLGYGWGEAAISVAGNPLSFDGTLNAVATGYGRPITGFTKLAGKTMGVFTDQATYTVTVDGSDFDQQTISPRNGAVEYTVQDVGSIPIYTDPRGIARAFTTDKYGDFEATRISHAVHPWLLARLQHLVGDQTYNDKVVTTTVSRVKSQYRMYFADGFRLTMTMFSEEQPPEFTFQKLYTGNDPDQYIKVFATDADVDDAGKDRLFFTMDINPDYDHGNDLGFVFEDDRGTSFNGDSYTRWIETAPIVGIDIAVNTVWSTWHLYGMAHGWAAMALTTAVDLAHPADPDSDTEDANYDINLGAAGNAASTDFTTYFNKDRLQQRGRHIGLRFQNASDRELPHVLQNIVLLEEKQARIER